MKMRRKRVTVELTRLTRNDQAIIDKLTEIEEEAFGEGGLNEWGLAPLIRHGAVYIVFQAETPVGVIEYLRDLDNPAQAYLYGLAVDVEYRGRGLGKKLLTYSLQQLMKTGIKEVELTVEPDNEPAINLYQQHGFKKVDYRADEYGPGEDRIVMTKEL
jgi:ribosomal-protein-alanine N-acetyltransferase